MRLGKLKDLQNALGGVGKTYASAVKKASGQRGRRLFDVDASIQWLQGHPEFKMTDIYPSKTGGRC
jgi:hypothetical protein